MQTFAVALAAACAFALTARFVESRPTIYMLNENDKLEPALIPVSSTVIPMPVYKVSTGLEVSGKKAAKPADSVKLITGSKKKISEHDDNVAINIKQISKEEFETQA